MALASVVLSVDQTYGAGGERSQFLQRLSLWLRSSEMVTDGERFRLNYGIIIPGWQDIWDSDISLCRQSLTVPQLPNGSTSFSASRWCYALIVPLRCFPCLQSASDEISFS